MPHDYEVGYRKPPLHTRFKKGRSGNPKGRPKGTKNLATDLMEELAERILIRENGRQIWVSKQRAAIKNLVAKALNGDARALALLVKLKDKGETAVEVDVAAALNAQEEELSAVLMARLLGPDEDLLEPAA